MEILSSAQNVSQKSAIDNIPETQLQNERESTAKASSILPTLQLPFTREVLGL
jgi:hypothetical protein